MKTAKALPFILAVCVLAWMASSAGAQPGPSGVGVIVDPSTGQLLDPDYKTPPLRTSDIINVPVGMHIPVTIPNWAGYRLKFHIIDGKELSVTPLSTLAQPDATGNIDLVPPTFPQSTQAQSISVYRTVWDPSAPNSGRPLPGSQIIPLANFVLHAKSTTPRNNSDHDLSVMAWNIRHLREGPGSTHFEPSVYVWAHSNFQPTPENPLPSFPPPFADPNAQWKHLDFPWHMPPGIGSQFIATLAGTAFVGIEHVPEPVTAVLAGGGVLLLVCSWGLRRRRMAA